MIVCFEAIINYDEDNSQKVIKYRVYNPVKLCPKIDIITQRPLDYRNEIIADDPFKDVTDIGLKVVKLSNGEYAYLQDGILLPYRFDIALNFNRYGYALVGKNGNVTWLSKGFRYLTKEGIWYPFKENSMQEQECFTDITDFTCPDYPLSRMNYLDKTGLTKTMYMNPYGHIQVFYGNDPSDKSIKVFDEATTFNTFGEADTKEYYLHAEGLYEKKEIIEKPQDPKIIDFLTQVLRRKRK